MNARDQYSLTGSAPEMYERNMVPAIFAPFAKGLLEFANLLAGEHVLDVACGVLGLSPVSLGHRWHPRATWLAWMSMPRCLRSLVAHLRKLGRLSRGRRETLRRYPWLTAHSTSSSVSMASSIFPTGMPR